MSTEKIKSLYNSLTEALYKRGFTPESVKAEFDKQVKAVSTNPLTSKMGQEAIEAIALNNMKGYLEATGPIVKLEFICNGTHGIKSFNPKRVTKEYVITIVQNGLPIRRLLQIPSMHFDKVSLYPMLKYEANLRLTQYGSFTFDKDCSIGNGESVFSNVEEYISKLQIPIITIATARETSSKLSQSGYAKDEDIFAIMGGIADTPNTYYKKDKNKQPTQELSTSLNIKDLSELDIEFVPTVDSRGYATKEGIPCFTTPDIGGGLVLGATYMFFGTITNRKDPTTSLTNTTMNLCAVLPIYEPSEEGLSET